MSLLQFPDAINPPNMQIWNNAAFSTEEANAEDTEKSSIKVSWSDLQPLSINRSVNQEPDSSKENRSPESQESFCKTPNAIRTPKPIKPLQPRTVNSQRKPSKPWLKNGCSSPDKNQRENVKIAEGIEEIEKEINRLTCKLAELRLQQAMIAEQKSKETENSGEETISDTRNPAEKQQRRGRIVPAKFMDQKKISKPIMGSEKHSGVTRRRGMSLGPVEIGAGFRQSKPEITPLKSIQNRRKSCYWKFQMEEIAEEKGKNQRGRSLSLSPKAQRSTVKIPEAKSRVYTVGAKKPARRDGGPMFLQPKKLFREGDSRSNIKPAAEKLLKNARLVASRYNQIAPENDLRKRSLPENEKEEDMRGEKKRGSSSGDELYNGSTTFCHGKSQVPESKSESRRRGIRQWEVPSKVKGLRREKMESIGRRKSSVYSPPSPLLTTAELLPRIRTVRSECETPRDSGCVKRAADRIGKISFFSTDENGEEKAILQASSFSEE